jgi:acylphosphatase
VVVHGRVQGVGFRYFVMREASALGLDGWVMNLGDGSVRCAAEGADDPLQALIARLRVGPAGAHVRELDLAWRPAAGEPPGFRIRSGGHAGD